MMIATECGLFIAGMISRNLKFHGVAAIMVLFIRTFDALTIHDIIQ
jgi:hypothetical protein